jgi:hypothetical protein
VAGVLLAKFSAVLMLPAIAGWFLLALAVAACIGWLAAGLVRSFPDYIAYLSEPFERAPHRYLVFSDLAWGKDLCD